jgi:hypothetical protein
MAQLMMMAGIHKAGGHSGYFFMNSHRTVILVPPEIWREAARDRRKLRALMRTSTTPEMVEALATLVQRTAAKLQWPFIDAPPGTGPVSAVRKRCEEDRKRVQIREDTARVASAASPNTPASGRRCRRSVQSGSSDKRALLSDQDLVRAGPSGQAVLQAREVRDAGIRPLARPGVKPITVAEANAWAERMTKLLRQRDSTR